jgi:hypothetical protein
VVSEYYLAQEIDAATDGILIAIPEQEWAKFADLNASELAIILLDIASYVNLEKYQKNPRGPKKPPGEKTKFKGHTHVSTAKLLNGITPRVIVTKAA